MNFEEMLKSLQPATKKCIIYDSYAKSATLETKNLYSLEEIWAEMCRDKVCRQDISLYMSPLYEPRNKDVFNGEFLKDLYVDTENEVCTFWCEMDNKITYQIDERNLPRSLDYRTLGSLLCKVNTHLPRKCTSILRVITSENYVIHSIADFRRYITAKAQSRVKINPEDELIGKGFGIEDKVKYLKQHQSECVVKQARETNEKRELIKKYGFNQNDITAYYDILKKLQRKEVVINQKINGKSVINVVCSELGMTVHPATQGWFDRHWCKIGIDANNNVAYQCKDGEKITDNAYKTIVEMYSRIFAKAAHK
jgi:hypothetical protein